MKLQERNSQSEPQGIFNENLRRSFDKLTASRSNQASTPRHQHRQITQKSQVQLIRQGHGAVGRPTSFEEKERNRKRLYEVGRERGKAGREGTLKVTGGLNGWNIFLSLSEWLWVGVTDGHTGRVTWPVVLTCFMKLKRYFQVIQPGNIILVNTSSEEEAEERKTTLNRKFLTRDTKIRWPIFLFWNYEK